LVRRQRPQHPLWPLARQEHVHLPRQLVQIALDQLQVCGRVVRAVGAGCGVVGRLLLLLLLVGWAAAIEEGEVEALDLDLLMCVRVGVG